MSVSTAKPILQRQEPPNNDSEPVPSPTQSTASRSSFDQSQNSENAPLDIKAVASIQMPTESNGRLFEVRPRMLSATEVIFESENFVELCSACEMILSTANQTPIMVRGSIVSCTQFDEITWSVTVRYDAPIPALQCSSPGDAQ